MKSKDLLLIPMIITTAISIYYRLLIRDIDSAIITHGFRTVTRYQSISNMFAVITAIIFVLYIILTVLMKKKVRTNTQKAPSEKDEETQVLARLEQAHSSVDSVKIQKSIELTINQIKQIYSLMTRFNSLYIDQNIDVFERVDQSLQNAKKQIIQNSKSIVNRITIEGCENEIDNKTKNNQKIIDDVKVLLNETVNYLDNKSTTNDNPLESITSSLRILNDTIKEEL